ncbi:MAG: 16S rRNA (guanine(527)-N(7))-methyltransferase RsmG [Candidatus Cloacimonetes bacterium 4572_65]|nr:MAG: 16S rRNA (guanine(527)-N(7))-methyltransferase RsmG [Candidatus Cloacimonetes bacterium 4572_65]
MNKQEIFFEYVKTNFPEREDEIIDMFNLYYNVLVDANVKINLFSRKMPLEDIWITHFMDSLLPYKLIEGKNLRILDFGTGGGLPGIPMAIINPDSNVNLLDSKRKKIMVLDEMLDIMGLDNVDVIWTRLEEYITSRRYDYIICRSVKIVPELKRPLMRLLKKSGKIILFKSKILDDVLQFQNYKIHDFSSEIVGTRKVVEIRHE